MGIVSKAAAVLGVSNWANFGTAFAIAAAVSYAGGVWTGARLESNRRDAIAAKADRKEQARENEKQKEVHKVAAERAAERVTDQRQREQGVAELEAYLRVDPDAGRAVLDADGVRLWNCWARGEACGARPVAPGGMPGGAAAAPERDARDKDRAATDR